MPNLIYNTKSKKFSPLNLLGTKLWKMTMFIEIKKAMVMERQALEFGNGQGSLACRSPLGRKESDTTDRLN